MCGASNRLTVSTSHPPWAPGERLTDDIVHDHVRCCVKIEADHTGHFPGPADRGKEVGVYETWKDETVCIEPVPAISITFRRRITRGLVAQTGSTAEMEDSREHVPVCRKRSIAFQHPSLIHFCGDTKHDVCVRNGNGRDQARDLGSAFLVYIGYHQMRLFACSDLLRRF